MNKKVREIQVDDIETMTQNVEKNLQINGESIQNGKNIQNTSALNDQSQQRVPVPHTEAFDGNLQDGEPKLPAKKNGNHSESPSIGTCENSIQKTEAMPATTVTVSQKSVTSKPQITSGHSEDMKENKKSRNNTAQHTDWEDRKFTIKCLEGHNDLISSVAMDGSVLLTGRFVKINDLKQQSFQTMKK